MTRGWPESQGCGSSACSRPMGVSPLARCCVLVPLEMLLGTRDVSGALPVSLTSQLSEELASRGQEVKVGRVQSPGHSGGSDGTVKARKCGCFSAVLS